MRGPPTTTASFWLPAVQVLSKHTFILLSSVQSKKFNLEESAQTFQTSRFITRRSVVLLLFQRMFYYSDLLPECIDQTSNIITSFNSPLNLGTNYVQGFREINVQIQAVSEKLERWMDLLAHRWVNAILLCMVHVLLSTQHLKCRQSVRVGG